MNIKDYLNRERLYSDGGFGTLLQARGLKAGEKPETWNITRPDDITAIHLEYLNAGADIISTNTFGANPLKFENLREIISAAFTNAKKAVEFSGKEKAFVAFMNDPLVNLPKEKARALFDEMVENTKEYLKEYF